MASQDGPEAAPIEASLRGLGTPQRTASEKACLKSDLEFTGTAVPAIRATVRAWCRAWPELSHEELIAVTEALWARPCTSAGWPPSSSWTPTSACCGPATPH